VNDRYSAVPVTVGPKYCTSDTRPPHPKIGDYIEETDTTRRFVFTGEAWTELLADPTEAWRAALGQSTSAQLRQTQRDLAASQADLTRVQTKLDALTVLNAELKAEAANWREVAERYIARTDEQARALAAANHRNRILAAENEAALRRLNEQRDWQVADRDTGITCTSCAGPIVRGQAFQPLADAKGFFAHVACPPPEEKP
jgi:hypothetical protein